MNGSPAASLSIPLFISLLSLFILFAMTEGVKQPTDTLPQTLDKRSWPEVVGLPANEAKKKIEHDDPGLEIIVIPPNCSVTEDYRLGRVRIFVDGSWRVAATPIEG